MDHLHLWFQIHKYQLVLRQMCNKIREKQTENVTSKRATL